MPFLIKYFVQNSSLLVHNQEKNPITVQAAPNIILLDYISTTQLCPIYGAI